MCGALRASDAGSNVVLMGWVNRRRDLGNLIFLDLRDRSGITQIVFTCRPGLAHEKATEAAHRVRAGGDGQGGAARQTTPSTQTLPPAKSRWLPTKLSMLNDCKQPPFYPADSVLANEEVRLKYRYIDLRRPEMQRNIELRHRVAMAIREYLSRQGFYEIETPFMTRSTPEGARDYLVPSRVHPGEFYALPQSPQCSSRS